VKIARRHFLTGALAVGALQLAGPIARRAWAQPRFTSTPFTLGVASGYPVPGGVVLWTRLAPAPLQPGGGMPSDVVGVDWEVASDDTMSRVVQHGSIAATADWAHSVHVEVNGLEPGRWYWYRFRCGNEVSAIGRTRTAPAAGAAVDRLRFAFGSCQQYEQGYYGAYHHMLDENLDVMLFLGDYIYESSWGRDHVRHHGAPEPITLDDYRVRHALHKTDADLQAAHAACPWIVTWDDHEVSNDYADDRSEQNHPREWFLHRRAGAYKAYYEHMPLRRTMVPLGPEMLLYHRVGFGGLVNFHLLDDRQYRSHQPCVGAGRGGSAVVEDCADRLDPGLTMLGTTQERWLETSLDRSRTRWNVIGQQTLMAQLDRKPGPGRQFWTDGWDGYPVARRRLLDYLGTRKPANPVVIGGDVHMYWVADLKPDFDDARSPVVATEIVGTSITSQNGRKQGDVDAIMADNPHIRYGNPTRRGYTRVDVTPTRMQVDLRAMRAVTQPRDPIDTIASFVVEDGRLGAVRA